VGARVREAEAEADGRAGLEEALPVAETGDGGREEEGDRECGGEGGRGSRGCGRLRVEKKAGHASLEEASPATPRVEATVEGEERGGRRRWRERGAVWVDPVEASVVDMGKA
jgi:hypothetical protein